MTQKFKFCLAAVSTLQDRDLATLTDVIEAYTGAGMDTAQAETAAVNDVLATVAGDRADLEALTRKQHADLFKSDRAYTPAAQRPSLSIAVDQTDTPAFKAWFDDSKVVDADGKPLVVYHGTTADFTGFDPARAGQNFEDADERGMVFSSGKDEPNLMADRGEGLGGNVMPAYLSLQNPLIVNVDPQVAVRQLGAASATSWYDNHKADILHRADRGGHDGVIIRVGEYKGYRPAETLVAFRPEQIKSATGNAGTFDPTNADIRADFSGEQLPAAEVVEDAGAASTRSAAVLDTLQAYFRETTPAFKELKLTALPPVLRPAPGDSAAKQQRYAAQRLATEVFNTELSYFSSSIQRFANGIAPHADRGVLFVNEATRNPVMAVFGHELLHVMRGQNEALYQGLKSRLEAMLEQPGRYHDQLERRYKALGVPALDQDKVREELIADIVGDNFTDPAFWRALAKDQPNLFQRVLRAVLDFLDDVLSRLRDERPYGTSTYLKDVRAARAAVVDVMRNFAAVQRGEAGPTGLGATPALSATNDTFYSELARQVEQATMKQAPASGWLSWLKGLTSKGVKADEIAWTGIEDWLDLQPGKVTRDQVLEYLKANGVQVTETRLGGDSSQVPDELNLWMEENDYTEPADAEEWLKVAEDAERRAQRLQREGDPRGATLNFTVAAQAEEMAERLETDSGTPLGMTKYSQYTLPGGQNYQELLLTLPGTAVNDDAIRAHLMRTRGLTRAEVENISTAMRDTARDEMLGREYRSSHWDQPNVLAHIRLNDRTDADGKKVLFVEEIQSDWAQAGKKRGFSKKVEPLTLESLTTQLAPFYGSEEGARGVAELLMDSRDDLDAMQDTLEVDGGLSAGEARQIIDTFRTNSVASGVSPAPFVQKTDAWVGLVLKRVIKMAVDGGYDRVAIVNGTQSADRYKLSKQISRVEYSDASSGGLGRPRMNAVESSGMLVAYDHNGKRVIDQHVQADKLEDHIGKEVAKRLIESTPTESRSGGIGVRLRTLEGLALEVGGEGMKAFYDQIVPKVAKEVVRKLGGDGIVPVNMGQSVPVYDYAHENRGWEVYDIKDEQTLGVFATEAEAKADIARRNEADANQQLGFDITDAMRAKAAAGVPLFSITGLTPPRETLARAFQRKFQDSFNRFTVIQKWAEKHGVNMRPDSNVWAYEERMHGRVATRVEDFREKRVRPAIEAIQKAGFTMEQVAEFLHAQHAEERNRQIATIDPQNTSGSGMTTAAAQQVLAAAPARLVTLANDFRRIADETRDILLRAGIISQDMVDAWNQTYQHYVPLKGGDEEAAAKTGTGKGLNVAGKQKRAMGHDAREEHIIENLLRDHERAIALAEKNRVGHALLGFVADLAEPDIATVGQPEKRKVLQRTTSYEVREPSAGGQRLGIFDTLAGAKAAVAQSHQFGLLQGFTAPLVIVPVKDDPMVAYMASPQLADNEVNVYVQSHAVRVQLNDERLAAAYTKSGVEQLNQLLAINRAINNFLSKAYTGYNPEFFFTNVIRDFTTGLINVTSDFGAGVTARAVAGYPKAFATLIRYSVTGNETPEIRDYRAAGGSTGSAYLSDLDRVGRDVQAAYDEYRGVIATLRGRGAVAAGRVAARKMAGSVLGVLEHLNAAGESAMRLSVFQSVRTTPGYTDDDAASAAKNATVNFNRKGEWGPTMGALYLFFNPGIQGTARILDGLVNGRHRKQGWALAASLPMLAYALAAGQFGGGDDDDDAWMAISDATKDKNLIIRTGPKSYITIPVPYGYGFLFSLGNAMHALQKGKDVSKVALNVASNLLEHFSPIGNPLGGDKADTRGLAELVPGAIGGELMRDAVRLAVNRSSLGGDIVPDSPFDKDKPDHLRLFRSTKGSWYDRAAGGMNALTGGTPATAGAVDVSPETIKFWVRAITGGTGAFLADSANLGANAIRYAASPDDPDRAALKPEPGEIPIARRFYKNETIGDRRRLFWDAVKDVEAAKDDLARARKMDDEAGEQSVEDKRGELIAMGAYTKAQVDLVKAQREAVEEVMADAATTLAFKRARVKEFEEEERSIYAEYVREFADARRDARAERATVPAK